MKTLLRSFVLVFSLFTSLNPSFAQWVQSASFEGSVQALAVNGTSIFAGTWFPGVYLSTDNGASWDSVNTGLTDTDIFALAVSGTDLYAGAESGGGTPDGGVFLSTNNGTNWTRVSAGLTDPDVMCLGVSGTNLFAGTYGGGVFLSTNSGTNWIAINSGLPPSAIVNTLAASGGNVYAGTGGFPAPGDGVFRSTNNGTNWTAVNTGLPQNAIVYALVANGGNVYAGTRNEGVFLSTNGGTSWTAVNTGLTWTTVLSFAFSGVNLFAGTAGGGVFLTTNSGGNWTQINAGFTGFPNVYSLVVSGAYLFAGTYEGGVWRRPLSEITSASNLSPGLPMQFSLEQNYPNPFNPATTIRYALSKVSFVTLTVFNMLGQQVVRLVNEQQEPGYHKAVLDSDELASGVYLYRLQAGEFVQTERMILLK